MQTQPQPQPVQQDPQGQQQITIEKVHQMIGKVYMDAQIREEQLIALLQQQGQQIEALKNPSVKTVKEVKE